MPLAFDGSQVGPPVGYFTYTVNDDHWTWSSGVFLLHGYAPDEVVPSTETLLSHKHPDDLARAFDVLETAIRDGRPFSCYHRVVDRQGQVRSVLAVGRGELDENGRVERLVGYFVDLTEARRSETEAEVEAALLRVAEHRVVIERARGMVMFASGCVSEDAFALLRGCSSARDVALHELAHELVDAVADGLRADTESSSRLLDVLTGSRTDSAPQVDRNLRPPETP